MIFTPALRKRFVERMRQFLGGKPRRLQVAVLPWRESANGVEVMLITSRGTGRWVLPKGWPEGKEAFWEAAAREAAEEAGLRGSVAHEALGSYYYTKQRRSGHQLRCEVKVYPLQVEEVAENWRERQQRRRQWMPARQAASMVREKDLAELIGRFSTHPEQIAA